jgi:hypothetical protein
MEKRSNKIRKSINPPLGGKGGKNEKVKIENGKYDKRK